MFQNQREFYLQEQLRVIHRELGEEDSDDFAELEAQVEKKALPPVVEERTLRELRKLRRMPPMSPEFTVRATSWTGSCSIPWTSAPTRCSMSRTREEFSTPITTASTK